MNVHFSNDFNAEIFFEFMIFEHKKTLLFLK